MGCFIGLDFGTKRIGIALSDELAMIASPHDTIHPNNLLDFIKKILSEKQIDGIVLGMPKGLRGEDTNSTQQVIDLRKHLERTFPTLPIHFMDERFTSKMASSAMVEGNLKKSKRREKGMIDKISAAIILQSFLDNRPL